MTQLYDLSEEERRARRNSGRFFRVFQAGTYYFGTGWLFGAFFGKLAEECEREAETGKTTESPERRAETREAMREWSNTHY